MGAQPAAVAYHRIETSKRRTSRKKPASGRSPTSDRIPTKNAPASTGEVSRESADVSHAVRPGRVGDGRGRQEEQALGQRVVKRVDERGDEGNLAELAGTGSGYRDQDDDEAYLPHARVCEGSFQGVPGDGAEAADDDARDPIAASAGARNESGESPVTPRTSTGIDAPASTVK